MTPDSRPCSWVTRGGLAGLVVGDDELAVGVELEAVDDAAQRGAAHFGRQAELEADRVHGRRVFEAEVLADELLGVVEEGLRLLVVEAEPGEVGIGAHLGERPIERGQRGFERATPRRLFEQQLERAVDERALRGPGRGRLGQAVDRAEPERERARLERLDLARRQAVGHREGHEAMVTVGWDIPGDPTRARSTTVDRA